MTDARVQPPPTTLEALRALSDDEVVSLYDRHSLSAAPGTSLYLGELDRRAQARSAEATLAVATASNRRADLATYIAVASLVVTMAAQVASLTDDGTIRAVIILGACGLAIAFLATYVARGRVTGGPSDSPPDTR